MRPRSTPLFGSLAAGVAAGLLAGLAMNLFARATLSVSGREAPDASPGADRTGRGMQPPQRKAARKTTRPCAPAPSRSPL